MNADIAGRQVLTISRQHCNSTHRKSGAILREMRTFTPEPICATIADCLTALFSPRYFPGQEERCRSQSRLFRIGTNPLKA